MSTIIDNSLNSVIFSSILISDGNSYESGSNYVTITQITGSDANVLQFKPYFTDITSSNELLSARLQIDSILSGINPTASAPGAATFGINNIATNTGSFVEGVGTLATGFAAHAAGFNTTASGYAAFSVGVETDADGTASFAAGSGSWARGTATVAFGIGTIASSSGQLVVGHYNEAKTDINNIFVVGDGTSNSLRRNVIEVYGGQGALFRGVKIDTVSPSGPLTTAIDGFNVYGKTIFYGGVTHSTGIITIDDDYGGITHGSASYIAETYTSLGALRGRTLFNYKGIDFNNSVQTTAPSSTHLWSDQLGELYYGSNAVILNNATNFTASNVTVSNVTVTGTASIAFLNVTYESASVIYSTGSNQFGDAANDTQTLYGSVIIPTGSLTVTGSLTTTGDITAQNLTVANITASENIRIGRTKSIGGNNFGTYNPILTYWNDGVSGAVQSASFGFRGSAYMDSIAYPDAFGFGTNDLVFFTSTNGIATPSEIMRIVGSSGRIGIGTSLPTAELHISGASIDNLLRVGSPTNANILFISGSGNIGVGTTTPGVTLDVSGNIRSNGVVFSSTTQTQNITINSAAQLQFRNTSSVEVGRFDNAGNWGIGTTSPTSRLQVRGSGATSATTALRVENANASASLIVLDNGNVGIGTTTPSASLHVQGNFQISTGSLYTYGQNTDIDSGSFRTVITIPTSSYRAAFFDYVLTSGSNARAGTVFSVWQGTSVEYADTSTNDIGNTTGVNLLVSMSGANIGLFASSSNDNWSMKALARML